jgi:hypothetical protein
LSVVDVIVVHCINSALLSSCVVVVVKGFIIFVTHSRGECHGLEKVVKNVWAGVG